MSVQKKYKLSFAITFVLVVLLSSLWVTSIPTSGFLNAEKETIGFKFGYIRPFEGNTNLEGFYNNIKDTTYFAGADRLTENSTGMNLSNFYPIYDDSSSSLSFNEKYTYLPYDMTGKYGRSVYAIDYGNAKMLFLRGDLFKNEEESIYQEDWLRSIVEASDQLYNIVFINEMPQSTNIWDVMDELSINLVITENELYSPKSIVEQEPADWATAQSENWDVWNLNSNPNIQALLIDAVGSQLSVTALNSSGEPFDQMKQDLSSYQYDENIVANALIPIQSLWRYHQGSDEIKSTIPEGYDITGENPITSRYQIPADDWRSREYDDSNWKLGKGPFGYMKEQIPLTINQKLPMLNDTVTYYFRKTFNMQDDPSQLSKLFLYMTFEDGYVAYLNGEEISRDGMKVGLVTHNTLAQPNETYLYVEKDITNHKDKLKVGQNTITVEVHRSHPKSSNFIFDLSLTYTF
ncbi:hypothetical protein [Chengkuizengella axinellae]|uniref:CAP-associated domain-containing protein n=1 Tax=Chengkuizengella axinellae TaxID=3064388 RepID=A0ABT9J6D8_9BACL|nr:hypothetical protein [Chengkuizengella sp. 2205SS18-9]MDP5277007.1 hypothetical protein [Chengkuizengella sp. 2205SS18-9]